jgi:transcriptional regulator with XRE-family HTH domain
MKSIELKDRIDLTAPDPLATINRNATARALEINPSNVSRILSGQRIPHLRTFKRLADYLGVDLDKLYQLLKIDTKLT